mmetsp:Transcript_84501/g.244001  ORF Transcript_84501/g.244001 Transcript_84501/m.244001 type:complete len:203 (-) Transcript_84501:146-754(-)
MGGQREGSSGGQGVGRGAFQRPMFRFRGAHRAEDPAGGAPRHACGRRAGDGGRDAGHDPGPVDAGPDDPGPDDAGPDDPGRDPGRDPDHDPGHFPDHDPSHDDALAALPAPRDCRGGGPDRPHRQRRVSAQVGALQRARHLPERQWRRHVARFHAGPMVCHRFGAGGAAQRRRLVVQRGKLGQAGQDPGVAGMDGHRVGAGT